MQNFSSVLNGAGSLTLVRIPTLHILYMQMLNDPLGPYALDVALSLVAPEDEEVSQNRPYEVWLGLSDRSSHRPAAATMRPSNVSSVWRASVSSE